MSNGLDVDRPDGRPAAYVTTYTGRNGNPVIQIDTTEYSGRIRINLNDAPIWDGDPDNAQTCDDCGAEAGEPCRVDCLADTS